MLNIKLILVTPSLKSGGGNRVFIELANRLIDKLPQVSIIYPNNSTETAHYTVSDSVKLIPVGKKAIGLVTKIKNTLLTLRKIKRTLKEDNNTIAVISDPIFSIFYMTLQEKYKRRTIRFIQADDYRIFDDLFVLKSKFFLQTYKWLCLKSYTHVKNVLFNSKFTYSQFNKLARLDNIEMMLVHPGIDVKIFRDFHQREDDKVNICLIARAHPLKGFKDFLDAWALLDNDVLNKVNELNIISSDYLGGFDIPKIAKIVVPNSDLEIATVMNRNHIFISTSWAEGFGLPPLEAMATGCAVICSNSRGVLEYAVDNENCMLYEPRNVKQLYTLITELVNNKHLRDRISSNGKLIAKDFTWENATNQFCNVLMHFEQIKASKN